MVLALNTDAALYRGVHPNLDLALLFPNDAHRIKMRVDGPETVSKAVFKIKIY